jgi:two-component system nitrate/nitrite response regulator NarL
MFNVLIVDDVCIRREGLAALLRAQPYVAGVATSGVAHMGEALVTEPAPDLVLLDASSPESWQAGAQAREARPGIPVLALGVGEDDEEIVDCLEAGFAGYLRAGGSVNELGVAIHAAVRGDMECSPEVVAALRRRVRDLGSDSGGRGAAVHLTRREEEVARLLSVGASNKEIARHLHISTLTVKNHVHSLLNKLNVRRRGEVGVRMQQVQHRPPHAAASWDRRRARL